MDAFRRIDFATNLYKASERAISLWDSGQKPFLCSGWAECGPGVFEVWLIADARFARHTRQATAILMSELFEGIDALQVQRIQTHVHVGFEPPVRWLEWLGFVYESQQPCFFSDGATALIYVMFPQVPRHLWPRLYEPQTEEYRRWGHRL